MPFCDQCGAEVKPSDEVCPSCGHALDGEIAEVVDEIADLTGDKEEAAERPQREISVGDETTSVDIGQVVIQKGGQTEEYIPYCRKCGTYVARDVSKRCPRCGVIPLCWRHHDEQAGVCAVCAPEAFAEPTTPSVPSTPAPPVPPTPVPEVPQPTASEAPTPYTVAPSQPSTPGPPQPPIPGPPPTVAAEGPSGFGNFAKFLVALVVVVGVVGAIIGIVISQSGDGERLALPTATPSTVTTPTAPPPDTPTTEPAEGTIGGRKEPTSLPGLVGASTSPTDTHVPPSTVAPVIGLKVDDIDTPTPPAASAVVPRIKDIATPTPTPASTLPPANAAPATPRPTVTRMPTPAPGQTSTFNVNKIDDTDDTDDGVCDDDCSLREAIGAVGPGDIVKVPAGTYTLTLHQLVIDESMSLEGVGAESTIIQAASQPNVANTRVFNIKAGDVLIQGVTIRHGEADFGGGIFNSATLSLANTTLTANVAIDDGGGIWNESSGRLIMTDSRINGNTADDEGGGIWNNEGTLTITGSTISDNTSTGSSRAWGGGIRNRGGEVTIAGSTVNGNVAGVRVGFGGGIYNGEGGALTIADSTVSNNEARDNGTKASQGGGIGNGSASTMSITNSVIIGNSASFDGGGIWNAGTLNLANSTVSVNKAHNHGGGLLSEGTLSLTDVTVDGNTAYVGGGIYIQDGKATFNSTTVSANTASDFGGGIYVHDLKNVTLTNSTISNNTADRFGGGIMSGGLLRLTNSTIVGNHGGIYVFNGTLTLANSMVGGNRTESHADCSGSSVTSSGHNMDTDGTCSLSGIGDLNRTHHRLGPLQDNGGPTQTHALLPGSLAIDAGDNAACPNTDQRGVARPQGATCDIGAFENAA